MVRLEWDGFGYDVYVIMCYEIDASLNFFDDDLSEYA